MLVVGQKSLRACSARCVVNSIRPADLNWKTADIDSAENNGGGMGKRPPRDPKQNKETIEACPSSYSNCDHMVN